jgi:hypothetical protein
VVFAILLALAATVPAHVVQHRAVDWLSRRMPMTYDDVHTLAGRRLTTLAMLAVALCEIVEEQIHAGQQERALETMRSVRRIMADIDVQVCGDSAARPLADVREAAEVLCDLDERLFTIASLLGTTIIR